ncbi:HNH endonuclease signature motif containing protein [Methylomonas sp. MO1]|uniref:HNH endonuclease n=1 Tax=unclassified Methylomonas TaxID=2608980 RepID=UPI0004BB6DAA|nr:MULTISPECIES: HNH endonuclease signature motif containing protein [unclassified Methylomonas]MDT4288137.1 HNH endonuclease signature motif containing protein [Methylomonas sp. MO1]
MASLFLNRLSTDDRQVLEIKLHRIQGGNCFICEQAIDLQVHKGAVDIDHVVPLKLGGKDDEDNFALAHASCNRSKQASNLKVARVLQRFARLKEILEPENRSPNLGDILKQVGGGCHELGFNLADGVFTYSLSELGNNTLFNVPVYEDEMSGFRYFFARIPIEYLAHDNHINPRSIGPNISKLIEEFYQKRPQLHVPLGWIRSDDNKCAIHIFDGQHKAAAQIMLGARYLPVRVFIDPDPDTLITTNTNAGTTLKQVAFDKSVQRHLGSSLYHDRIARFQKETGRSEDDLGFSERDLVNHFKGQSREIKRYILDALRDGVISDPDNKLRDYIDFGGRGKERPLSYSTIEKTFYSFFVYQEVLETPINFHLEEGSNPRQLEREQILRLMNLAAEEIYVDKFDPEIGTDKIENRLQNGESFAHDHLRAFRMSKEEIVYNWLQYSGQIARQYFIMQGRPDPQGRLFQYPFPEQVWENMRKFLQNLASLPLWVNTDLSATVFGGKQNNSFWKTVFETGRTPQGMEVLARPLNLIEMIK